uniref:Glabrous enhancer-binding protein-like DBD domain-containing protein n=1 Tax=Oryza punctata TaxID=4537 RepID=A0A0E0KI25_ORYPU
MASDQTLPVPVSVELSPAAPNPDPTAPLPLTDDPSAPPAAARKLPVKRRSPPPRLSSPSSSDPASSDPAAKQPQPPPPPFKFQRIWSESDELRFLQGLLGCGAQGLVFPRDLNVFYDRFSESMPSPYTRSQLSEKLRRLKNKFRGMSARVARGLDPARLAPHDRDVLHLCSRLWDPASAATSPFAAAGDASSGNKRRRAAPRSGPLMPPDPSGDSGSHDYNGISSGTPGAFGDGHSGEEMMYLEQESGHFGFHGDVTIAADGSLDGIVKVQPETLAALPSIGDIAVHNENGNGKAVVPRSNEHHMANAVLDIFEECLREVKANGITYGANVNGGSELAKRWRAQRIDELDVLSRRLRLLVEDAAAVGR